MSSNILLFFHKVLTILDPCVSHSIMSNSLWPHGLWPARIFCPWNSPGKNTRVGSHSLFQGIFLTQKLNPGLLHCRQILYHLSHQGSPRNTLQSQNIYHLCDSGNDQAKIYQGIKGTKKLASRAGISISATQPWRQRKVKQLTPGIYRYFLPLSGKRELKSGWMQPGQTLLLGSDLKLGEDWRGYSNFPIFRI